MSLNNFHHDVVCVCTSVLTHFIPTYLRFLPSLMHSIPMVKR